MAEGPRRRLRLVCTLLIGCVLVVAAQLVKVQIVDHAFWEDAVPPVTLSIVSEDGPRGVIRDRNQHLLVGNAVAYSIEADPGSVEDVGDAAAELAVLLHVPVADLEALLRSETRWVLIKAPVSRDLGDRVAARRISGITVRSFWQREYPEGSLAAHALGFCNAEGKCPYGVEGYYDGLLRPPEPEKPVQTGGDESPWMGTPVGVPQPGTELVLTLDRTVQALAEEELARSVRDYQAEGGTIIVMDPRTFEILALASLPNYHPGSYYEFCTEGMLLFDDPAVSRQYEPGSVFKVLTVAAAVDAGLASSDTVYEDRGLIEVGGQAIENAFHEAYGQQTVADVLIKSLNVGAAWLSTQVGPERFYRYLQAFGIGRHTLVDLAGEVPGTLWLPRDFEHWHDSNLGTNAFGQGVAVTPLQMIAAVATVANDGARLRPHILHQRISPDGGVSTSQPVTEEQAIAPQTANLVAEMMVRVVEEGVPEARVAGYRIAGKTGTAQIPIPGGYASEGTITTFVGFGPVPDPQVIILVKLDRPKTSSWAHDTAAPAFQRLAERLFVVLGIPPQSVAVAEAAR